MARISKAPTRMMASSPHCQRPPAVLVSSTSSVAPTYGTKPSIHTCKKGEVGPSAGGATTRNTIVQTIEQSSSAASSRHRIHGRPLVGGVECSYDERISCTNDIV